MARAKEAPLPRISLATYRDALGLPLPDTDASPCWHDPAHVVRVMHLGAKVEVVLACATRPFRETRLHTAAMAQADREAAAVA